MLLVVTAVLLVPVAVPFWRAFGPDRRTGSPGGLDGLLAAVGRALREDAVRTWLTNSLLVTTATLVVSLLVAAPAGYVLSRGRSRSVRGLALLVFGIQSVPILMFTVPLFVLFTRLRLNDTLPGVTVVYVGLSVAVATWMMSSSFDAVPAELEEAAWLDGCSVLGGFVRVVLSSARPGVLSAAVYVFLLTWNDYWIALVFLRSEQNYTIGLALAGPGSSAVVALVAMLPPLVVFGVLNRYFSVGGVGGALTGR